MLGAPALLLVHPTYYIKGQKYSWVFFFKTNVQHPPFLFFSHTTVHPAPPNFSFLTRLFFFTSSWAALLLLAPLSSSSSPAPRFVLALCFGALL